MYNKPLLVLLVSYFYFSGAMQENIVLNDALCVYPQLPAGFDHLSIERGRILLASEWLDRFYDNANFFPVYKEYNNGKKATSSDPNKSLPTFLLVGALFYKPPYSASMDVTRFVQEKNPLALANIAAYIASNSMSLVEHYKELCESVYQISNIVDSLSKNIFLKKEVISFLLKFKHNIIESNFCALYDKAITIQADNQQYFKHNRYTALHQKIAIFLKNWHYINSFKTIFKELFEFKINISPLKLTLLLSKALHHHYPFNSSEHVVSIITAFFYKSIINHCGADADKVNASLTQYYTQLSSINNIKLHPTPLPLKSSSYVHAHQLFLDGILKNSTSNLLYYYLQSCSFPHIENHKVVQYVSPDGTRHTFSNCMENAVVNFLRMLSFDRTTGLSNVQTLQKTLQITLSKKAHDRVAFILNNYKDHNCWIHLFQNIPHLPYINNTPLIFNKSDAINSTQKQKYLFELKSSLLSLAGILNHFFELDKKVLDTSPTSATDYFDKIIEALHMRVRYFDESGEEIDQSNVSKQGLLTVVLDHQSDNFNSVHNFIIGPGHSEYFITTGTSQGIESIENHPLLKLGTASFEHTLDIWKNILIGSYFSYRHSIIMNNINNDALLFCLPLNDGAYMRDMIRMKYFPKNSTRLLSMIISNESNIEARQQLIDAMNDSDEDASSEGD